jgi:hypothetical protein
MALRQYIGRGVLSVLTVVIALELFDLGSAAVGWLNALLSVGGLLVGPLAVLLVRGKRWHAASRPGSRDGVRR